MKTYLECIPCFFKQCVQIGEMCGFTEEETKAIVDAVSLLIPKLSIEFTPPEMAGIIIEEVNKKTGIIDPYLQIKRHSAEMVKRVLPSVEKMVKGSDNPLLMAVKLAIAGNIIDYGANCNMDVEKELQRLLSDEESHLSNQSENLFNFEQLKKKLKVAKNILYIGDNVGENFFDKLLIDEMIKFGNNLNFTYATREIPVLNDILVEDAIEAGIDKVATVISSGSKLPGTVLSKCTSDFVKLFESADLIISKGQGNYETLSSVEAPIFFLLMAKCPVVAKDVGCQLRDTLLIANEF